MRTPGWDCYCPNGHQLWTSWLGTSGCLHEDCEYRRKQEPGVEVCHDPHEKLPPCGHRTYVGWGPKIGCRTEGCKYYLPGIDVTKERT